MLYRAIYADDEMEIFRADDGYDACDEAWSHEEEHGLLFELCELNDDYDEVRYV